MAKRKPKGKYIWIEVCSKGYRLYYVGFAGPTGKPVVAVCVSKHSVKATITRWSNRHGKPESIEGLELLETDGGAS